MPQAQVKEVQSIQFLLRRKFDEIRGRNSSFSLRAFAKKLDIHPAALSEILNGKRTVSTKLASRIALSLNLTEKEREQILSIASQGSFLRKLDKQTTASSSKLDLDNYFLVSEWYYYAILSLSETDGFKANPKWVSERLGISMEVTINALERLFRLGYFTKTKSGKLSSKKRIRLSTSDDVANAALKRRHEQNFQAAQEAVRNVPVELREFTFITMAIDQNKLSEAKPIIREFREKLCSFLEEGKKTEVYELCLSLFPRTILKKEEKA